MLLQFTLSHQVARLLSCCPATVRGHILRELSQKLTSVASRMRPTPHNGLEVGVLRLPSGFQVSYQLDRARQQVEMLDLSGGGSFSAAAAPG
ncbi:hypothetical protein JRI60_04250 [Archangium violaceum]|uniref:hypothetical protein n=1 Tax=Archangium violaceum TaxID=83451 RepID=UPI00194EE511|nr:hypothetical protein [Archangium violaceum]QRN98289.1 hypothetical protein JRI60_04250 [Archangium violaceum]